MNINATLFAQLAVFLILSWFTMKFIWPPLIQALDARNKKIADGLAAAELGQQELTAAKTKIDHALTQAHEQGQSRIAAAERQAQLLADEMTKKAQAEAARIIANAHDEVATQISQARDALRQQVAALAVKGAEQILAREINQKAHEDMLSRLKAEL